MAWTGKKYVENHSSADTEVFGLIDTTGKPLTDFIYLYAYPFVGDLAKVILAKGYIHSNYDNTLQISWGYVNRQGKTVALYAPPKNAAAKSK